MSRLYKNCRFHLPANVPVKLFWSVVAYDALSRSELPQVNCLAGKTYAIVINKLRTSLQPTRFGDAKG